ncbi:MAG: flagellar basal-body MS-ring/collar protein FliF [Aquificaceae bacterium]
MERLKEVLRDLNEKFTTLSLTQKLLLIGIPLITLGILITIITFLARPNYTVLYAGLSQEDMTAIVSELDKENVKYNISPDGRSILVPENQARDIRLKLAAKGIPSKGLVGYEIFDKDRIGTSDFQNQVNFKRAVEGELARTILRIEGIEDAKVNIGMPQKSIFVREEEEPTASVFLKLRPGYEINPEQIKAIRNLVSASVPRLRPEKVVVVDNMGKDLTALLEEEETIRNRELKIKLEFEKNLERKIQKALEEVLGYDTVKVKVYADLDLTKKEQKEEIYDPDMTAIVSQQKKKERTTSGGVAGVPGAQANIPPGVGAVAGAGQILTEKSETLTNYEVSKKEIYIVDPFVKVKRLSVGVLVDSNIKNLDTEKIKKIVEASAGIDPQRGDTITVESIPFQRPEFEKPVPDYEKYIRLAISALLVFLLAGALLFILRRLLKKKEVAPLPTPLEVPTTEVIKEAEELRKKAKMVEAVEAVVEIAKEEPDKVANIIRKWLRSKS